MSRAFVKEDSGEEPVRAYRLPPRDAPGYNAAAASVLLEAARVGDTAAAEEATGFGWGASALRAYVEEILVRARDADDDRLVQVAERFLRKR